MSSVETLFGARTAMVVDDAISAATAAELRARLTGFERYRLVDRGSYEHIAELADPAIARIAVELAARATGRELAVHELRALRLHAGDYLLAHHDRVYDGLPLEVILDLSPAVVPGAEVHYRRRGSVVFRVASRPRACAIVERGPAVTSNHTYISRLHQGAEVLRVIALLR